MFPSDRSRIAWHAWRWTAPVLARLHTGSGFLPRSLEVRADLVPRIGNRRLLYELSGTNYLRWLAGRVVGGDWDLLATPVGEHAAYSSFHKRFLEGADWEQTSYWKEVAADVRRGTPRIGCRSIAEVTEKFRGFDRLWRIVGTSSYWPMGSPERFQPWEAVLVGLARNGDLVLVDGRHRLIMAHLKRCRLHVLVIVCHARARTTEGRFAAPGPSR